MAAAAAHPGGVIAELGSEAQRALLDEVAAGETAGAGPSRAGAARLRRAGDPGHQQGDSWTVTAGKNPVLAGDSADVLVVTATLPGGGAGLFLVDADATSRQPYRTFDGQRGAEIVFDGAAAEPLSEGRRRRPHPRDADPLLVGAVRRRPSARWTGRWDSRRNTSRRASSSACR